MSKQYPSIGSVSTGTLKTEDLAEEFIWELGQYNKELANKRQAEWDGLTEEDKANGLDSEIVADLEDDLNNVAPPYAYFGAHEGDGADFGFWPILDDPDLPRFEDVPDDFTGDAYQISDHGNVTCGRWEKGELKEEYWAIV